MGGRGADLTPTMGVPEPIVGVQELNLGVSPSNMGVLECIRKT